MLPFFLASAVMALEAINRAKEEIRRYELTTSTDSKTTTDEVTSSSVVRSSLRLVMDSKVRAQKALRRISFFLPSISPQQVSS